MCIDQKYQQAFTEFGNSWTLTEETERVLEAFVCQFYGGKNCSDINACRYKFFCFKKGEIESNQLPLSDDCLHKHSLRSNYQADVWRRCLECDPQIPSPYGCGWIVKQGLRFHICRLDRWNTSTSSCFRTTFLSVQEDVQQ